MIVEELKIKYNLEPNSYYLHCPYKSKLGNKELQNEFNELFSTFCKKWDKYTEQNWYGCGGLGFPMPIIWLKVLDEFLDYILKECPDFKILQLKTKFGSIRIYLNLNSEDIDKNKQIQKEINLLEELLFDKFLIY